VDSSFSSWLDAFWAVWYVALIAYVIAAVVVGLLCAYVADQKGRSGSAWFFLGLFFGIFALIAIAGTPPRTGGRCQDAEDHWWDRLEAADHLKAQRKAEEDAYEEDAARRRKAEEKPDANTPPRGRRTSPGLKIALAVSLTLLLASLMLACAKSCSQHSTEQDETPASSVSTPPPVTRSTQLTAPSATWRTAARWSGSGMKQTETFSIRSSEWRISWKTTREVFAGAGILQVYVYGAAGELVSLAANLQGVGSDVSYVHAQPGRFYLDISSANVDWEVVVEDLY